MQKIIWKENMSSCQSKKRIYFIYFEWRYIIKIIKLLEDFGLLNDGVTEAVKHEIKKQEARFLGAFFRNFNRFISATSNLFSSISYKYKKS